MACNVYIILGGCSEFFGCAYWKGAQVFFGFQEENKYNSTSKLRGTQPFPLCNPLNFKPYYIFPILFVKGICFVLSCQCLQPLLATHIHQTT